MELFEELIRLVRKAGLLIHIEEDLVWDQQVMMPPKGLYLRSQEFEVLAQFHHEAATNPRIGEILQELQSEKLSSQQEAVVREVSWSYSRLCKVPKKLLSKRALLTSKAHEVWRKARKENNYELFKPYLKQIFDLSKEYARYIDASKKPYEVLLQDFESGLTQQEIADLFDQVKKEIIPLLKNSSKPVSISEISVQKQKKFNHWLAQTIGFDYEKGRFDESEHPFTAGYGRITTRYTEGWVSAIFSTIHEAGHAFYELNLPLQKRGTPLGESRSLSVHESQSRIWENCFARSPSFWKPLFPKLKEDYDLDFSFEDFISLIQQKSPNLIRVNANELEYMLHIILRFEIEQELLNEEISFDELPAVWNKKIKEYIGLDVPSDSLGVLQDVHWSGASIGYFPTYAVGSLIATQLYASLQKDLDIETLFEQKNYEPIHQWLCEKIHSKGQVYTTKELIKKATGKDLSAQFFIDYAKNRYGKKD